MKRVALLFLSLWLVAILAGCAASPAPQTFPAGMDQQAVSHNQRVCIERGMVWDAAAWGCR